MILSRNRLRTLRTRTMGFVAASLMPVLPMSHAGSIQKHSIPSRALDRSRDVQVALPASYDRSNSLRYPVLYLLDGQNVFSTAGPGAAFGWGGWDTDLTAQAMAREGFTKEIILVAVHNSPARYQEYKGPSTNSISSDSPHTRYTRFMVEELKPWVDRTFRTLPSPSDTAILGSSMGGLASLAIAWSHPTVFGGAGCLSGAFQVEGTNFLRTTLMPYAGAPKPFRIYIDSGVTDFTGGDDGRGNTERVVAQLRRIGWRDGINLRYEVDATPRRPDQLRQLGLPEHKWEEAQRSQHNEFYWRIRFRDALRFLFPSQPSSTAGAQAGDAP